MQFAQKGKIGLSLIGIWLLSTGLSACVGSNLSSTFEGIDTTQKTVAKTVPESTVPENKTAKIVASADPVNQSPFKHAVSAPAQLPETRPAFVTEQIEQPDQAKPDQNIEPVLAYASTQDKSQIPASGPAAQTKDLPQATQDSKPDSEPENSQSLEQLALIRAKTVHASMEHGTCAGGFGPKPKKLTYGRSNPSDPFYIEIRMRQTPLMPVGHTYVAYGSADESGRPIDENLIMLAPVGGYVGAAFASGIPVKGVLSPHPDDCRIKPDIGYRFSLTANQYLDLLSEMAAARAKTPNYLLFQYNCNHFASRIAGSVGIKPPKNVYVPAIQYIYDMIKANRSEMAANQGL